MRNDDASKTKTNIFSLFNVSERNPIRRFYDIKHSQSVLSVSWMKRAQNNEIVLCVLYKDGRIRFLDITQTQSYVFDTMLPSDSTKYRHLACCKCANSLIAVSNAVQEHSFSVQRLL